MTAHKEEDMVKAEEKDRTDVRGVHFVDMVEKGIGLAVDLVRGSPGGYLRINHEHRREEKGPVGKERVRITHPVLPHDDRTQWIRKAE